MTASQHDRFIYHIKEGLYTYTEGYSIVNSGTIFLKVVAQSTTTTVVDQQVSTPPQITPAGETEGHTEMQSGLAPLIDQIEIGPRGPSR